MEREKLYSCGLIDHLLDKESSIKNPLEKIEDIKNCIIIPPRATKRTIQEQINMQIKIAQ